MEVVRLVYLFAKEFESIDADVIYAWIDVVAPMVSKKQFGKLYKQALAYMVCHKMKMAGYGEDVLGDSSSSLAALATGFGISSISEGGSSISFNTSQGTNLTTDAELALTIYGLQFLQLRKTVIVPIHCGMGDL